MYLIFCHCFNIYITLFALSRIYLDFLSLPWFYITVPEFIWFSSTVPGFTWFYLNFLDLFGFICIFPFWSIFSGLGFRGSLKLRNTTKVLKGLQKCCGAERSNYAVSIHQSLRKWGPCQKQKLWKPISTPQEETNMVTLTRPLFLLHGEGIAKNMKAMASSRLNGCSGW